jgi:hypothetical protein
VILRVVRTCVRLCDRTIGWLGVLAASFCVPAVPLRAQEPGAKPEQHADRDKARDKAELARLAGALAVSALAGQTVPVLPLTYLVADSSLKHDTLYAAYRDRATALAAVDSAIGGMLVERGPEVQWVLPAALRKMASRSPGMVKDPDELGQAVLRSSRHKKEVPQGAFRSELRNLIAVSGGRAVLVPAALTFSRQSGGGALHADLTLVLVDGRAGKILWRSVVSGDGATPSAALESALNAALPLDSTSP